MSLMSDALREKIGDRSIVTEMFPEPIPKQEDVGFLDSAIRGVKSGGAGVFSGFAGWFGGENAATDYLNQVLQDNQRAKEFDGYSLDYITDPSGLAYDFGNLVGSELALLPAYFIPGAGPVAGISARGAARLLGSGIAKNAAAKAGAESALSSAGRWAASETGQKALGTLARYGITSAPIEALSEGGQGVTRAFQEGVENPYAVGAEIAAKNLPLLLASNTLEAATLGRGLLRAGGKAGESIGRRAAMAVPRATPYALAQGTQQSAEEIMQERAQEEAFGEQTGGILPSTWTPNEAQAFQDTFAAGSLMGLIGGTPGGFRVHRSDTGSEDRTNGTPSINTSNSGNAGIDPDSDAARIQDLANAIRQGTGAPANQNQNAPQQAAQSRSAGTAGEFDERFTKWESSPGATNLDGVRPEVKAAANAVMAEYGDGLTITGGAEKGYHAAGEHGHEGGWKIDIDKDSVKDKDRFLALCAKYGFQVGDEGDHYDLSGHSESGVGGQVVANPGTFVNMMGQAPTQRDGDSNAWAIYDVFRNAWYSDNAIAGILGRVQQEHNFDTSNVEEYDDADGRHLGGYGMFQWNGGRTEAFLNWAKENNLDPQDASAQAQYALVEAQQRGLTPDRMNNLSVEGAADLWTDEWEVGERGDERQYATEWMNRIQNGGRPSDAPRSGAAGTDAAQEVTTEDDSTGSLFEQFARQEMDSSDAARAEFFRNAFDEHGNFIDTQENRQTILDEYGEDFEKFLRRERKEAKAQKAPESPKPPKAGKAPEAPQIETKTETLEEVRERLVSAKSRAADDGDKQLVNEINKALRTGDESSMREIAGRLTNTQPQNVLTAPQRGENANANQNTQTTTATPQQAKESPTNQNQNAEPRQGTAQNEVTNPPKNTTTQATAPVLSGRDRAIRDAFAPIAGNAAGREQQVSAIRFLARQNGVTFSRGVLPALNAGAAPAIARAQQELRDAGISIPAGLGVDARANAPLPTGTPMQSLPQQSIPADEAGANSNASPQAVSADAIQAKGQSYFNARSVLSDSMKRNESGIRSDEENLESFKQNGRTYYQAKDGAAKIRAGVSRNTYDKIHVSHSAAGNPILSYDIPISELDQETTLEGRQDVVRRHLEKAVRQWAKEHGKKPSEREIQATVDAMLWNHNRLVSNAHANFRDHVPVGKDKEEKRKIYEAAKTQQEENEKSFFGGSTKEKAASKATNEGGEKSAQKQEKEADSSNQTGKEISDEDVATVKQSLIDLARKAWSDKSAHDRVSFTPSQKLRDKVKELFGHDINEVFITSDGIRHLRNNHGEGEEKRGQVNFVPDMAGDIYDTVNDFDSATKERDDHKGNQNILVVKKGDGDSFALLVERGKNKAEIKTFYKKTKTPPMFDAKSPNLNAQSDSAKSSVDSTIPQNQQKGNKKESNAKHSESQGAFSIGKINGKHQAKLETQLGERYVAELGTIAKNLGGTANKGKKTFTFKDRDSLDAFLEAANAYVSLADPDTMAKLSISAYHGSPNDFEMFSLDHIGEGEGSQVHGWGLYFAGERRVSEGYRDNLTEYQLDRITVDGKRYKLDTSGTWVGAKGVPVNDSGLMTLIERLNYWAGYSSPYTIALADLKREHHSLYKRFSSVQIRTHYSKPTGSLFQVEIPDEDVLLDEQKTFGEQSKKVRKAISDYLESYQNRYSYKKNGDEFVVYDGEREVNRYDDEDMAKVAVDENNDSLAEDVGRYFHGGVDNLTGGKIYRGFSQLLRGDKNASEKLNDLGIKGISYDGRQDGRCYVIFDDQAIDIIGKFSASGEIRKILAGIQMVDNEELNSQQRKISEIGEAMGVPVVWIDADSRLNGFHQKGVTFLNRKAGMSLQKTFWHEQFHWLRNNNDDLWRELLTYFKGKDAFSKKQIEAYQKKTGRYDLTSDEAVIEEMLADAFMDVSRRVPIMKELARDDRSLAQKLVAWIKDMMNRFVEMFHNPEGRLTTEQRDIFVKAFGKLARDMVDADGKKIFKTYDDGKTIRLADGSELAGVRLSTGKKKFSKRKKYSFAGVNAENAPLDRLERAKEMDGKANPDKIYEETGWFKGKDGKWRFEIPDNLDQIDFSDFRDGATVTTLGKIYDNQALYDAYSRLKDIRVGIDSLSENQFGAYNPSSNMIVLNGNKIDAAQSDDDMKKTLVHEIQHAIQGIEGFAVGGSMRTARDQILGEIRRIVRDQDFGSSEGIEFASLNDAAAMLANKDDSFDAWWQAMQDIHEFEKSVPKEKMDKIRRLVSMRKKLSQALDSRSDRYLYENLGGEQEAREVEGRADSHTKIARAEKESIQVDEKLKQLRESLTESERKQMDEYLGAYNDAMRANEEEEQHDGSDDESSYTEARKRAWKKENELADKLSSRVREAVENQQRIRSTFVYEQEGMKENTPKPHDTAALIVFGGKEFAMSSENDVDNSENMGDNVIEEVFERAKQPRYLRIINDGMNYEEVVERLLEPENIAVSRALSLYEIRERNNDSTTIPRQKLKAFLQVDDTRRRALKDERGRKTLHEILRQHGRIREGSNLERTLSGRDIQGIRLSDGTNRQSGIDVKIPGEFGSLYEHAVVKELLQEISEESRKSVKASADLNNDTIKRSEKSASSMPKNKLSVSEKPSRTGNRKSTFFTVDSDIMDVSGHIPENGIPFIDNLWYKDEYAADPTDLSTVSPKVLRKGNATNHVLAVIDYLKDKGYDKFQIKTMSEYSEALMESMEEKGYVKSLSKWRNEGDNVSYQILKTSRSKDSTVGTKFSINASDNSTSSLAHRIKNILAGTPSTAQVREQYRRKMARMIEDALGVKIRTGKLDVGRPENGTVVYKEKDKVIRSLHAYDWENILPMASGLMAERLGIVGKAADTTAAMRNYISTWILTGAPNNTSADADTFHRAMQEHPHFADRMLAIREQFQEWADKSTQEQMRGTVQWTKEKSSTWKERKNLLYEELVEELAPVEDMVKQYEQETGEKLEASLNPMTAFRLLRGAHGRAITMIEGVGQAAVDGLKANFPNINFDGFKTLHTILDEIGALQNQEKQQDFAAYCIAKHILDMHRKNRQNRLEQEKLEYQVEGMREQVKEDTQKAKKMKERLALYQGEMAELRRLERRIESNKNKIREAEKRIESLKDSIYDTPEAFTEENCEKYIRDGREKYDQAQKALVHFSNTTAAILADSGVISNKRYQELLQSWPNYVPLFRVFEENKDIDFGDSMKRIKGSMRDIVNPLESIVHNTVEFVKKAEKNKAKSLLADFARCDGTGWLIEEVDNNSPNTETVITFYENGQRKYLETDPSIVKAVNNMDRRNSNAVLKFLHAITSVARACFTMASPEFAFRNIFRDYADAAVYNKFGFISPMDLARGFMHAFRRDNVYYEWLSSGAAQASAVSLDRNYTQEMIDKLGKTWKRRLASKQFFPAILEALQKASEYSEYATRIAMYEKAKRGLNKGKTRQDAMNALIGAAFESRDLMDFARHGRAGAFWNKLVPFANASIQGMNKFYRTMDWRNGNKKQAVRAFVRLAMSSILPAMLLFLMHHDDDWFKELPNWVKETHWVFKVGDTIIRIPKGSDVGVRFLSNAVEKGMAEAFNHDRVKATEYFTPLYDSLPNLLPIAMLPLLEASLNRSTFTGRNIVPQYQEKFTPKMQYGPYTTGMAKFLGEKLGIAPSKIDHVVAGYTGSIGMAPWKFLDVLLGDRQLDTSITEMPLTRALTYMPYKNPKSVQKYYEELDEQTKLENEFKMTHKRPEGFNPALLQRLKDSKKQMSVLSKQERDLINNPNLTMDERKRRQFVIQQRRIRLVERIIK